MSWHSSNRLELVNDNLDYGQSNDRGGDMSSDNTLLITGANRGIGLEYVRQYAEDGWRVIACCREPERASVLNQLASKYSCIEICKLDVADFDQIEMLGRKLIDQPIHLLINNAGVYPESSFRSIDYARWMDAFKVNTMSSLKLAEVFIPHLVKAGNAKFVAMTSKMGSIEDNSSGGEYLYRTSKTALNMVIKSLSVDLTKYGVSVATLHPGWVKTDMGGPNGLIDAETSVQGLRKVIALLSLNNSGKFYAYDGKEIPW
jgi:NAD(P)-dependent dehydrogenase (short-subunit alcohol dehydrogenase family)